MKSFQVDQLSWEQLVGRQPPSNTPLKSGNEMQNYSPLEEQDVFKWPEEEDECKENYQNLFPSEVATTQTTYTLVELHNLIERNWDEDDSRIIEIQKLRDRWPIESRDLVTYAKSLPLELKKSYSHSSSQRGSNKQSPQLKKTQSSEQGLKQMITQFTGESIQRQYQDPTVMKKKQEMQDQTQWLSNIQQNKGFVKDLKFKLNQLADANFNAISASIIKIIKENDEFIDVSLQLLIDKASHENKYRSLYSQICAKITKDQSIRKKLDNELLKRVQYRESQSELDSHLSTLQEDEKLIYLTKKKKKQIGLLKFCGQLFMDRVFKVYLIDDILLILIEQYLKQEGEQKYNEESLEYLIHLVQFVGKDYFKVPQDKQDIADEKEYFRKLQTDDESFHFSQKGLLSVIQKIQKKHSISQRVSLLLQNMFEIMENNWTTKKRKGSTDSLSDKLSDKQEQEPKKVNQVKVEKLQKIHENTEKEDETSVMKPLTEKDIEIYVNQAFKNPEPDRFHKQMEKQLLNRISQGDLLNKFWICFLSHLLDPTKENVAKASFAYQIYENYQLFSDDHFIIEQINKILIHDKIYDLMESPYGESLLINLLLNFFKNNTSLVEKLYFNDEEEIQQFTVKFLSTIFKTLKITQNEAIQQYISQFNAEFQAEFWTLLKENQ